VFLIFLGFEALLFSIFTMVMFATQLQAICSDETVIFYCFLYVSKTVQNNFYNYIKRISLRLCILKPVILVILSIMFNMRISNLIILLCN